MRYDPVRRDGARGQRVSVQRVDALGGELSHIVEGVYKRPVAAGDDQAFHRQFPGVDLVSRECDDLGVGDAAVRDLRGANRLLGNQGIGNGRVLDLR